MDIEELKKILSRYGLKPNFTYGQNFLLDDSVLEDMMQAADAGPDDAVLEIGPGIGNLTRLLAGRAGFVLSVEKDPQFIPILKSIKRDYKNFRYEIADILEYDYAAGLEAGSGGSGITSAEPAPHPSSLVPRPYKVIANIPYYITGKILQMFLAAPRKPRSITVLTQYEVAEQIAAGPGAMSILGLSVQLYGEAKIVRRVPAKSFYPAPKVDSAIVHIRIFGKPKYEGLDEKKFFRLAKACFAGKRKQIHNTLKNNLHLEAGAVDSALKSAGIAHESRPQELSLDDWVRLMRSLP